VDNGVFKFAYAGGMYEVPQEAVDRRAPVRLPGQGIFNLRLSTGANPRRLLGLVQLSAPTDQLVYDATQV
jgi:hypothetical protein